MLLLRGSDFRDSPQNTTISKSLYQTCNHIHTVEPATGMRVWGVFSSVIVACTQDRRTKGNPWGKLMKELNAQAFLVVWAKTYSFTITSPFSNPHKEQPLFPCTHILPDLRWWYSWPSVSLPMQVLTPQGTRTPPANCDEFPTEWTQNGTETM